MQSSFICFSIKMSTQVKRISFCLPCHQSNHQTLDLNCQSKSEIPLTNITTFKGPNFDLSNFYSCSIFVFGYHFSSSEHAYQWNKAVFFGKHDLVYRIAISSLTPLQCKQLLTRSQSLEMDA